MQNSVAAGTGGGTRSYRSFRYGENSTAVGMAGVPDTGLYERGLQFEKYA